MQGRICSKTVKPSLERCDRSSKAAWFFIIRQNLPWLWMTIGIQLPQLKLPESTDYAETISDNRELGGRSKSGHTECSELWRAATRQALDGQGRRAYGSCQRRMRLHIAHPAR